MNPNLAIFLSHQFIGSVFKIGFFVILFLLELFLLVVLKQIRSMNAIITQPDLFPYLQMSVIALMLAVVVIFIASLAIL